MPEHTQEIVFILQNNYEQAIEVSDDNDNKLEEETQSGAEMRKYLYFLALQFDRTGFLKMNMLCAMKAELDGHLKKTFSPKETLLPRFFCAE